MFAFSNGLEYKYNLASKKFQVAFNFLKRKDLRDLKVGWIELDEGVRASVQSYTSFAWNANKFESHEKYFDVQYVVEGMEYCGVCSTKGLQEFSSYDKDGDIVFYEEPLNFGKILLREGDFIVLAPEDAHKPRCLVNEPTKVKKIVVKVPVEGSFYRN